jgi:hypothetical protein
VTGKKLDDYQRLVLGPPERRAHLTIVRAGQRPSWWSRAARWWRWNWWQVAIVLAVIGGAAWAVVVLEGLL